MAVQLFTRDQSGNSDYQIDRYTKLDVVLKHNDVGAWSVALPITESATALAQPGMSLIIESDNWKMAGPVTSIERDWGGENIENGYIISGLSDNCLLWERICYPCLPNGTPPTLFSAEAHDSRNGAAETLMIGYVRDNIGGGAFASGSLSQRTATGLAFSADQGRGSPVSYAARFDVLGELLQQLAVSGGGLNFDIEDSTFIVSQPTDLSSEAVFSERMGNLVSFQYSLDCPKATHVIVGGGDQDVSRTFVMGGDDIASGLWRRIELFHDQRGTVDTNELTQTLSKDLIDDAASTSLTVRPIDIPSLNFGTHYRLGDIVTVEIDGVDVIDVVRQVEITLDENGMIILPTLQSLTSQGVRDALSLFSALKKLNRRVASLERAA